MWLKNKRGAPGGTQSIYRVLSVEVRADEGDRDKVVRINDDKWTQEVTMIYISIITTVIALVVGLVACLNYRINRENFRLALFEKRFAVFEAASQLLAKIGQDAAVEVSDMGDYLRGTANAEFLFDDSVIKFLEKVYADSNKLRSNSAKLKGIGQGKQRNRIVDNEEEVLDELGKSLSDIREVFMPYLGFTEKA